MSYAQDVLAKLKEKNASEPEFIQAATEVLTGIIVMRRPTVPMFLILRCSVPAGLTDASRSTILTLRADRRSLRFTLSTRPLNRTLTLEKSQS